MDLISDIDEVVRRLDEALIVRRTDIAAGSAMCSKICFVPPEDLVAEIMAFAPGSRESYEKQMKAIFERIAGHPHQIEMEGHDTDFMTIATAFPYGFEPKDVGYWTMAYGYLLSLVDLPRNSKILEIGFGAGGLTELLVRSGLDVTAVELRESNCQILRKRVEAFGGRVNCIRVDNIDLIQYPDKYDAIVFYEAFHHMPAPRELLQHLTQF